MDSLAETRHSPEKLEKKILLRLMPLLMICYLFAFLDRTNIALAKADLEIDLGISAAAYGLGAGLFFLAYAAFEIPSNLIMHKVGARWWIFRIMITWGVISGAMAFINSEGAFYVLRVLLGIAEAGFFPGVIYYFTKWLPAEARARAIGLLLVTVCVSSVIGNPIGGALLGLDGLGGYEGWRWLFLIEAIPTVLLAFAVLKFLPDSPSRAPWLDQDEAIALEAEIAEEQKLAAETSGVHSFGAVFKDRQMQLTIGTYWCHQLGLYCVVYFLPAIIASELELISSFQVGLLTAIPWIAAAIGAVLGPKHATTAARSKSMVAYGLLGMALGFTIAGAFPPSGS